ncbi:MAG: outer membrane protein assembly factor BamB, partial [Candidatus Paceibacteria bacterium]
REPGLGAGLELREDTVELLDLNGKRLEQRSLYKIVQSKPDVLQIQDVRPNQGHGVHFVDLIHANSVEFLEQPANAEPNKLFAPGNVLVSMRHQDAVIIFHWETGELIWSWGRGEIYGPHDATVLDNGHLLIFDNGLGRGWSRVVEVDPNSGQIVWQYRGTPPESFYSASRGSNQRLPNGNTLIAQSDAARAFEITPDGKPVWVWVNPARNEKGQSITIVRIKRLPVSFVEAFLSGQ